jgi:hypothetical protein
MAADVDKYEREPAWKLSEFIQRLGTDISALQHKKAAAMKAQRRKRKKAKGAK